MSVLSAQLPDDLEAPLAREAERSQRSESEAARDVIVEYLARQERERFLGAIARAAREPGENSVAIAEEALDNEALEVSEMPVVREPRPRYRPGRKKR